MKKLVALVITLSFLCLSITALANSGPNEVVFENKQGTVTFNHLQHQENISDCTTCHHKGVEQASCSSCHDGIKAPAKKVAFHGLCKDCHKKNESKMVTGKKCSECHIR
jgi:hypothetical protein